MATKKKAAAKKFSKPSEMYGDAAGKSPKTPVNLAGLNLNDDLLKSCAGDDGLKYLSAYQTEKVGDQYVISYPTTLPLDQLPAAIQAYVDGLKAPDAQHVTDAMLAYGMAQSALAVRDSLVAAGADPEAVNVLLQRAVDLGGLIERMEVRKFEKSIDSAERQRAGARRGAAAATAARGEKSQTEYARERAQFHVNDLANRFKKMSFTKITQLVADDVYFQDKDGEHYQVSDRTIRSWVKNPRKKKTD